MVKPSNCPWQLQLSSYYYYSFFSFFFAHEVYRTNTKPVQVRTPSGPKNTDPVSVTLTYFSRSQTHFCAKNPKLPMHITSLFMIRFRWNLVVMDYYTSPCWWPTFDDLDLVLQVKLEIGPIYFVTGLAKSRHRRIILATSLDRCYQGPLRIEVWWRLIKYSLKY